jgi:hypothetical protein
MKHLNNIMFSDFWHIFVLSEYKKCYFKYVIKVAVNIWHNMYSNSAADIQSWMDITSALRHPVL